MGFTGAHVLYTFDAFILALYLLFHGCAFLKYMCKHYDSNENADYEEPSESEDNDEKYILISHLRSNFNEILLS